MALQHYLKIVQGDVSNINGTIVDSKVIGDVQIDSVVINSGTEHEAIKNEVTRATEAERELGERLTTEVSDRTTACNNLSSGLSNLSTNVTNSLTALSGQLTNLSNALQNEINRATQAEGNFSITPLVSQINTINNTITNLNTSFRELTTKYNELNNFITNLRVDASEYSRYIISDGIDNVELVKLFIGLAKLIAQPSNISAIVTDDQSGAQS